MNKEFKLYRKGVENQWDAEDINYERDIDEVKKIASDDHYDGLGFDLLRESIAMFGAAETEVTEDLSPLAVVSEDLETQYFITSQLYDEARHSEFFKYYWNRVINKVEKEKGLEVTDPTDQKFFPEKAYQDLFEANEKAMHKLLDSNTPKNRVNAYSHYHLTLEGIVAQTGYWSFNDILSREENPSLSSLLKGINMIRNDEARHVGFGVHRIKKEIRENNVGIEVVKSVPQDLFPEITKIFNYTYRNAKDHHPVPNKKEILTRVTKEHKSRIENIEKSV